MSGTTLNTLMNSNTLNGTPLRKKVIYQQSEKPEIKINECNVQDKVTLEGKSCRDQEILLIEDLLYILMVLKWLMVGYRGRVHNV